MRRAAGEAIPNAAIDLKAGSAAITQRSNEAAAGDAKRVLVYLACLEPLSWLWADPSSISGLHLWLWSTPL
ncbi:MAG: hypothetical protein C5B60_08805 [Chloroflexi bacterium]|nr:MAG: hypothetical protein C5B60_08805 [Chloroflexota bacterium]